MTAEEAIRSLRFLLSYEEMPNHPREVFETAIEALEEVEQYRALGTVEELKEAKEKQIPKKPDFEGDGYDCSGNLVYDTWICPNCEADYEVDYEEYECCPKCGQAIDWS